MSGDDVRYLPAFLIARNLAVSRQLVYWWIKNGKLSQAETAKDGRPLYDRHEAARLERDMRHSPQSHRPAYAGSD